MFRKRPYQLHAENSTFKKWDEGEQSLLGVMATGGGKTVVFANIIKRFLKTHGGKAIVFAGTRELVFQAKDKIERVTGLNVEIEMGDLKASMERTLFTPHADVVCATWQTSTTGGDGGGRMSKFNPEDFSIVIIDEADGAVSWSYKKILDYFRRNPKIKILGVTATPERGDNESLGQVFNSEAFEPPPDWIGERNDWNGYDILYLKNKGWLVPVLQKIVHVESIDISNVKNVGGDLSSSELSAVMVQEKPLHGIVNPTIDAIGSSKRGIGFAASVEHARLCSNIMNRHRSGMSAWVSGKTEDGDRAKIISDFARGEIQFLWNYGVFSRGFDDSGVEIISQGRPTKSISLYKQFIGRGTRPHESIAHKLDQCPADSLRRILIQRSCKPHCLVLDFVGNSGKHNLVTTANILGGNVSPDAIKEAVEEARGHGRPVRMDKLVEEKEKLVTERKKREADEAARKAALKLEVKYSTNVVDPFSVLSARPTNPSSVSSTKKMPTEPMKTLLRRGQVNPDGMNYNEAHEAIGILKARWGKGLCSPKQVVALKSRGYENAADFTYAQADQAFAESNANKKRKPANSQVGKKKVPPRRKVNVDETIDGENPY